MRASGLKVNYLAWLDLLLLTLNFRDLMSEKFPFQ